MFIPDLYYKDVFSINYKLLKQMGITYQQIKDLIATSEDAQIEWDLCVELQRGNAWLNPMAAQVGFSPEDLDLIFKIANGEAFWNNRSIEEIEASEEDGDNE